MTSRTTIPIAALLSLTIALPALSQEQEVGQEPAEESAAPELELGTVAPSEGAPPSDVTSATAAPAEQAPSPRQAPEPEEAAPAAGESARSPELPLVEAQRIALDRSPSLRAALTEIDRADALIQQGWGFLLPSIGGSASYVMADQPTVANFDIGGGSSPFGDMGEIVIRNQHTVQLGLNARLPLFSPRAISGLLMAHDARDVADTSIEQVRRQLTLAIAQAFYATITARRTVALLDRQIELAQEHVDAARARLEAQAGLAIDVARAELELANLRNQSQNASLLYGNARDGVALLLGIAPDDLPRLAEPAASTAALDGVDDLVTRAQRDRLDLEVARGQVRLADRDLQSVWMGFLPSLDLNWSLTHTLTELGGFGDRRTQWNLAVVANFPIFDGGIRYGQLRERRARAAQARLTQEALEQSVVTEVRQAYRRWRTSMITREISERQLELAQQAHRLAIAAYQAGAASNLEVVDAQRALTSADVDVELQRLNSQLALVVLMASLEVSSPGGAM